TKAIPLTSHQLREPGSKAHLAQVAVVERFLRPTQLSHRNQPGASLSFFTSASPQPFWNQPLVERCRLHAVIGNAHSEQMRPLFSPTLMRGELGPSSPEVPLMQSSRADVCSSCEGANPSSGVHRFPSSVNT